MEIRVIWIIYGHFFHRNPLFSFSSVRWLCLDLISIFNFVRENKIGTPATRGLYCALYHTKAPCTTSSLRSAKIYASPAKKRVYSSRFYSSLLQSWLFCFLAELNPFQKSANHGVLVRLWPEWENLLNSKINWLNCKFSCKHCVFYTKSFLSLSFFSLPIFSASLLLCLSVTILLDLRMPNSSQRHCLSRNLKQQEMAKKLMGLFETKRFWWFFWISSLVFFGRFSGGGGGLSLFYVKERQSR